MMKQRAVLKRLMGYSLAGVGVLHVRKLRLPALLDGLRPEGWAIFGAGVILDVNVQDGGSLPDFAAERAPLHYQTGIKTCALKKYSQWHRMHTAGVSAL